MESLKYLKFLVIRLLIVEPDFVLDLGRKQNVEIIKLKVYAFKPTAACAFCFTTIPGLGHVVN